MPQGNKIYIAGPMTGIVDLNFPKFNRIAQVLRNEGWEVINPAEINPDVTMKWEDCMRRDIAELLQCQHIYMLSGWMASKGAFLEYHIAFELGLSIWTEELHNARA